MEQCKKCKNGPPRRGVCTSCGGSKFVEVVRDAAGKIVSITPAPAPEKAVAK